MSYKTCYNCGTKITKEYCENYPDVCEHWTPKKTQTNYERIKAMSLEEMAAFLDKTSTRCNCAGNSPAFRLCDDCPILNDEDTCDFAGWLMKEANE